MRAALTVFAIILTLGFYTGVQTNSQASWLPKVKDGKSRSFGKVDFTTQVKPILETGCRPCHFNGGPTYERLPFDRPETIKRLGARLFTRIKDKNERRQIRDFLNQQ